MRSCLSVILDSQTVMLLMKCSPKTHKTPGSFLSSFLLGIVFDRDFAPKSKTLRQWFIKYRIESVVILLFVSMCSPRYHHVCVSEINRVRKDMYSDSVNGLVERHPLELPEPIGPIVHLQEKLFVPVKEYPDVSLTFLHQQLWVMM